MHPSLPTLTKKPKREATLYTAIIDQFAPSFRIVCIDRRIPPCLSSEISTPIMTTRNFFIVPFQGILVSHWDPDWNELISHLRLELSVPGFFLFWHLNVVGRAGRTHRAPIREKLGHIAFPIDRGLFPQFGIVDSAKCPIHFSQKAPFQPVRLQFVLDPLG